MSDNKNTENQEIFPKLGADSEDAMPTEIESLCVCCEENGTTRMLFTEIPHFKQIILASFECPHCGYRNQEVQFGGSIADKGATYTFKITKPKDINRQVVKSDTAVVKIPEIDFEIPAKTQQGTLNTIEGVLMRASEDLAEQQPVRRAMYPDVAEKIDKFIEKLDELREGNTKFTFILDDPAGNSFIQNPNYPDEDPNLKTTYYTRSEEQERELEYNNSDQQQQQQEGQEQQQQGQGILSKQPGTMRLSEQETSALQKRTQAPKEVMTFDERCSGCGVTGELKMMVTDFPHFKEVIIMAFSCDNCGYRSNEIKAGGAISEKGRRITLKVTDPEEDLSRDILKSDTSSISIPELRLTMEPGSMGGMFTTVEGLLNRLHDNLKSGNTFALGDSASEEDRRRFETFLERLKNMADRKEKFTLILDDPVANSYLQNLYAPDPDPNLTVEEYERSEEQNENLGLNDINVD